MNNGRLLVSFHECRCATSDSAMLWKPPLGCGKVAATSVRNPVASGCATAAAVDKPHYLGDGCVSRYRWAWRLRVALDKRYSGSSIAVARPLTLCFRGNIHRSVRATTAGSGLTTNNGHVR